MRHSCHLALSFFFVAVRLSAAPAGSLDPSFGANGSRSVLFPASLPSVNECARDRAVAVQPDGKIVIAGTSHNASGQVFAVARFNADGTPDGGFGDGGQTVASFGAGDDIANGMALQEDGKIVVVGQVTDQGNQRWGVLRLNANGSRDTSFSDDGLVITAIGGAGGNTTSALSEMLNALQLSTANMDRMTPLALAVHPNGKIIVTGYAFSGSSTRLAVARYNSNGSLDTSFSDDGLVMTSVESGAIGASVVVRPDGRIVVGGCAFISSEGRAQFALVGYNPDGSLDSSFDGDGRLTTEMGDINSNAAIRSLALQNDGRLIAAGLARNPDGTAGDDFALARYLEDGALDVGFGVVGKTLLSTLDAGSGEPSNNDYATGVAVRSDGRIVVVGHGFAYIAMRLLANGTLDSTFGLAGRAVFTADHQDLAQACSLQADGKLIIGGHANGNLVVMRLGLTGVPDPSFASSGVLQYNFLGVTPYANGMAVVQQADGKLVLGGQAGMQGGDDFFLARVNADGSMDNTFGSDGIVTQNITTGPFPNESIECLAVQSDGKIIAAGYAHDGSTEDVALARFNANGTLDATFGTGGKVITAIGNGSERASCMVIQPDGKILVAGWSDTRPDASDNYDFALLRYNDDGTLDTGFSGDGIVTTGIGAGIAEDKAASIALQSDGKIVLAGHSDDGISVWRFATLRYLANGDLDASFDTDGIVTTPLGSASYAVARSVIVQPDGGIVVAGTADNGANLQGAIVRYTSAGALDASFSGDGIALAGIGAGGSIITNVRRQPDGKLMCIGYAESGGHEGIGLARFLADGTLDATFNDDGVHAYAPSTFDIYHAAGLLQPDGKIVTVGTASLFGLSIPVVHRFRGEATAPPNLVVERPAATPISSGSTTSLGSLLLNNLSTTSFIVRNTGTGDLDIESADVTGASFTLDTALPGFIAAGQSVTVAVSYVSHHTGTATGAFTLVTNDATNPTFTVNLTGFGISALENWRTFWFGSPANSGDGADDADWDKDSVPNLMEFALLLDPSVSNVTPISLVKSGPVLQFHYSRGKAAVTEGVNFIVEWSDTMQPGTWGDGGVVQTILFDDGTTQQLRADVPVGAGGRRFARLRLE